jgi:hypothetical protein
MEVVNMSQQYVQNICQTTNLQQRQWPNGWQGGQHVVKIVFDD